MKAAEAKRQSDAAASCIEDLYKEVMHGIEKTTVVGRYKMDLDVSDLNPASTLRLTFKLHSDGYKIIHDDANGKIEINWED